MTHPMLRPATRRAAACLTAGLLLTVPALACTDVRLIAADGTPFTVRTMEFAADLQSDAVIVPRGRSFTSPGPKASGLTWTSKYGYVFMSAYGQPAVTDGLNEKGLGFGALYLPGETEYETVKPGEEGLKLIPKLKPDLVIMDVRMGGITGMETLRRIRQIDSKLLVILMTAYGTTQTAIEAMKLGAYDYLLQ